MPKPICVSPDELIQQIKLSCQMPTTTEGIINRHIVMSVAEEMGIQLETEELQQAADAFRVSHNLLRADQTQWWLQEHCLSVDEFEEIVRLSALSSKLAQYLFAAKVEPFFAEHQLDYAQVVLYEVVLDDSDLAMELFYAIQENEISFYEVAHHYVQEPELRRSCGYRGVLSRQQLKPEVSAAVFAATPPQLLKPIMTAKGAHLIFVEEIIQPSLDKTLYQTILSDLFLQWLKQQANQAEVVIQAAADPAES
ncbi:MAG TPA: peptidylprolyl isomerase, partial [Allocoleopsis sp.]